MPVEVILPKVDMDMATGRISRWFFKDGATVTKGDALFEIETDKAAMEIDAPASGTLRDVAGKEGVDIPVGQAVAWIYEADEERAAADTKPEDAPSSGPSGPLLPVGEKRASSPLRADGSADVPAAASFPQRGEGGSRSEPGEGATRASPLARRLARESRVEIATVAGSGPRGRVVKADVEAAIAADGNKAVPAAKAEPAASPAARTAMSDSVLKLFAEGSYEVVPHSNMRRTIARRLVEAKSTVPHFYLAIDCGIDALLKLRAELNASAPAGEGGPAYKLSVNDMVIKAYALALHAVPAANVSWTEEGLLHHRHVDIGVAVSIPGGLITPIVRHAETKTLSLISNEMKDLTARAKVGKLRDEEYQGGTGAVSNLGMFGIREFAAIINPPHATILAVGAGERRAVVVGDDLKAASMMTVTLSTDHRAVDGSLAAELIGAFKTYVERPMSMLV